MIVNSFQEKPKSVPNLFVSEGRCQFCHNTAGNVDAMIAGDSGFICNQCVQACAALLNPAAAPAPDTSTAVAADRYVFQRLVRHFTPMRPHEMLATSRA
jgi:hypothetical protein